MNNAKYEILWQSSDMEIKGAAYADTDFALTAIFSNFSLQMEAGDSLLIKKVRDDV